MASQAQQAVDAMGEVYGRHPGCRAVHAKGSLVKGTFSATPEAAALSMAAHMQGGDVPVTVRFSNGSGDPHSPDRAQDGRGMATKFYLPDRTTTDIVAISLPCFFVSTPEDFVKFISASKPIAHTDIPSPRMALFLATHPNSWRALRAVLASKPIPSYANCRYNALHAFRWVDAGGEIRHVRYSWLPEAGEVALAPGEAKGRAADYLQSEISERVAREPVRFTLQLQIAAEQDPVDDATAVWPDERRTVTVGTLALTGVETGRESGDDVLVFDPARITDGIELSGDPLVTFRSQAYSVSVERRS